MVKHSSYPKAKQGTAGRFSETPLLDSLLRIKLSVGGQSSSATPSIAPTTGGPPAGELPFEALAGRDPAGGDPATVDPPTSGPALAEAGHRARLRARLLAAGPLAVADHELIEMVLFLALPRRDTKPIARALVTKFGSFASAISAPLPDLLGVDGLGEAGAAALKIVQAAAQRLAKAEVLYRPVLGNWDRLMEYLQSVMAREKVEHFRILFLDNRNRLLADEQQARGTVNHTPVYPREIVKRALELHATAVILVHNHPSGDPSPSEEDIAMTKEIKKAASALSIVLHDHIIVGNGQWLSFRKTGLL